jgi:hypothetical protein
MSPRPNRTRPGATSSLAPQVEPLTVAGAGPATESPAPVLTDPESAGLPKYQRMVRKEARLRPDQVDALAQLRRRITRGRHDRSETITDNTLLRVAVDLLLERGEQLAGDTEDQLRDSVTDRAR